MGSRSDWDVMRHASDILRELAVPFETRVVSARRTPGLLFHYAEETRILALNYPEIDKALAKLKSPHA
ncbi:MAG: AIR carboxylase family protein [Sulfuricella sp.]|nr:AIR carboxylase family protein [Sulfuricella sp.]